MNLRLMTDDSSLIYDLLEKMVGDKLEVIQLSDSCKIKLLQKYIPTKGMIPVKEILEFSVDIIKSIGVGLLTAWLYDLVKNRRVKAEIDGKKLPNTEKEIEKIIIMSFEEDSDDLLKNHEE